MQSLQSNIRLASLHQCKVTTLLTREPAWPRKIKDLFMLN